MNAAPLEQSFIGLSADDLLMARELLVELGEHTREIAKREGRILEIGCFLAELAHKDAADSSNSNAPEYALRAMAAEVAAVTHTAPVSAKTRLETAERIVNEFPSTHAALQQGEISLRHAEVIHAAGANLDRGARASLDDQAAELAIERTPGELKKITKKCAAELAPKSLNERHLEARKDRRFTITDLDDGMSEAYLYAPTLELRAVLDRATQMAKATRADRRRARREYRDRHGELPDDGWSSLAVGGETTDPLTIAASDNRTIDQLRVDLLTDLLLTATPSGHELHSAGSGTALGEIRANVQVTVPASMLLDPDDGVCWMDDGRLISPDAARIVAGKATSWDRLFVRPDTGEIEAVDRYRPSEAQRRALVARDLTCRFPGCTTPARKCDIDHSHDYALGGKTTLQNLACLCEAHHMLKHQTAWSLRQGFDGELEWTSPTGRVIVDRPASGVFFRDTAAPGDDDVSARETSSDPPESGVAATVLSRWCEPAPWAVRGDGNTGDGNTGDGSTGASVKVDFVRADVGWELPRAA